MRLWTQIRSGKGKYLKKDITAGIVVALVSIPIAMGYAQLAGLPMVYGLYGSILPILVFGCMTTSPQFVVGVDAMPAVMVGGILAQFGMSYESADAMQLAALMSFLTAAWFLVFYFLKAGRIVKYISTPVMGGFISGVGLTIILMQIPKLFGGSAGVGELPDLLMHIKDELPVFHPLSAFLGFGTVLILLICKKRIPRVPMTVIMMVVGAALQFFFHLDRYGVRMLPEAAAGLPQLVLPDLKLFLSHAQTLLLESLSIAAVIMAQTLLASGSYALKYNDALDHNAELLAYAGMNLAGGLVGCCPINGSVSRSGIADSFGCRSQIMSITAGFTMLCVLLFGTPLLKYLPVPVLTGIVMCALIGILETTMVRKLWKTSKNEWAIFMTAFAGVLFLGTVNGVMVGVLLSFFDVAIQAVSPSASFLGRIPGQGNYYTLERNSAARPIRNTVIYRFSGNLFFANIDRFQQDIEEVLHDETHTVIVDARGIGSIDITAADRLVILNRNLRKRGIRFYLTEHDGSLNDQLRTLGAESLIEEGAVRRTISLALRDAGMEKPYELEGPEPAQDLDADERLSEFEWAFGKDAEQKMELLAQSAADELIREGRDPSPEEESFETHAVHTDWGTISLFDENEFLDFLEIRLEKLAAEHLISEAEAKKWEVRIENRRANGEKHLGMLNPGAIESMREHRAQIREHIRERHPEEYMRLIEIRDHIKEQMEERMQDDGMEKKEKKK